MYKMIRLLLYISCPLIIVSSVIPFIAINQTIKTFILLCRTHYCSKKSQSNCSKKDHINTWLTSHFTNVLLSDKKEWVKEVIKIPLLRDVPRLQCI